MPKTLNDALIMLQKAGCAGPWAGDRVTETRTEIRPHGGGLGRMVITVCHQSSGAISSAFVEADYTIRDDYYEEREIKEHCSA